MKYPVNTSSSDWLEKVIRHYSQRENISITDDGGYDLKNNPQILKSYIVPTTSKVQKVFIAGFYSLGVLCLVLAIISLTNKNISGLAATVSIIGYLICWVIPTYILRNNKAAKLKETEKGLDVIFK